MRRHKYTHEGGKRYECNVCGKTYTQHYDVVRHKANVHGIIANRARDHANKGKKIKRGVAKTPARFAELVPAFDVESSRTEAEVAIRLMAVPMSGLQPTN